MTSLKTNMIFMVALLAMSVPLTAQSVIQGPKCTGTIHGVVYEVSGPPALGLQVIAFPFGVDLGAFLPDVRTDRNGEYRFEHVCHGKYTVIPDDEKAGYPSTFPGGYEFLFGIRSRSVRLNAFHRHAELVIHLPPKPGSVVFQVHDAETKSLIPSFDLSLRVPGQHLSPEESTGFNETMKKRVLPVPAGRNVVVSVKAAGHTETSKSILVPSGTEITLDLCLEPIEDRIRN